MIVIAIIFFNNLPYRKFKTGFGGFITILVIFVVACLLSFKLISLICFRSNTVQKNSLMIAGDEASTPLNIVKKGMTFAFSVTDYE